MKATLALLTRLTLAVGALAATGWATAQENTLIKQHIPADAKRVTLDAENGVLSVKGEPLRLSPALQVRDAQNRLKLTQSLGGRYPAAVQFDANGAAMRVWLLPAQQ